MLLWIHERVCDIGRHYSALIQYETNSQQLLQESGRCNLREKTLLLGLACTSRNKVMLMMTLPWLRYFWFHSIYSLAASCSLQSANVVHRHFSTIVKNRCVKLKMDRGLELGPNLAKSINFLWAKFGGNRKSRNFFAIFSRHRSKTIDSLAARRLFPVARLSGIFRLLLIQGIFPIIFTLKRPTESNHFTV